MKDKTWFSISTLQLEVKFYQFLIIILNFKYFLLYLHSIYQYIPPLSVTSTKHHQITPRLFSATTYFLGHVSPSAPPSNKHPKRLHRMRMKKKWKGASLIVAEQPEQRPPEANYLIYLTTSHSTTNRKKKRKKDSIFSSSDTPQAKTSHQNEANQHKQQQNSELHKQWDKNTSAL